MKKFFPLVIFSFLTLYVSAQDPKTIFTAEKMVFLGLDYTRAKFALPDVKPAEYKKTYFEAWNSAIAHDTERFNKESTFEKVGGVGVDLTTVTRRNAAIKIDDAIGKPEGGLTQSSIENVIADYTDVWKKEGLALVIIVESMSKGAGKMVAHIVFFDIATRKVLLAKKMEGEAGGPGLVNYWANPVSLMFREISKTKFAEWKKEVMKK